MGARFSLLLFPAFASLSLSLSHAKDVLTFDGPLSIPNVPRPVTVHSGDFNNDGKIDLVVANSTATVLVLFQNPSNRLEWQPIPLRVGSSSAFARAGDFDNDGFDDLIVADGASTAFFVRSMGDGTFAKPQAMVQSRGPRWVTVGDWNSDGNLDAATSNLNTSTVSIVVGDGTGHFTQTQAPPSGREHTLEALDYDGDGLTDLALGQGLPGIQLHKGQGDGKFVFRGNIGPNIVGCVEYIATGDFNNDGKSDVATTCIDDSFAYIAISNSTNTVNYKQVLKDPFATGTESSAVGDLNGDKTVDAAFVSAGSTALRVYLSKGDGTFQPKVEFGPTGTSPNFLIIRDLDGDGRSDVISSDNGSSTLTVFFGKEGERFLQSADSVTGYGTSKGAAVVDFDKDGLPDLFFASSAATACPPPLPAGPTCGKLQVYLKPGGTSPTLPSLSVILSTKYSSLDVADLNGDGIPDIVGANLAAGTAHVALLDAAGTAHDELTLPVGQLPQEAKLWRVDSDPNLDMLLPLAGTNQIAVLSGLGGGKFADARLVNTVERPKHLVFGDIDADGKADIMVMAGKIIGIHYGKGDGNFDDLVFLVQEVTKTFTDGAVEDLDKDGFPDLILGESRTLSVIIYRGKGNREFQEPVAYKAGAVPSFLLLMDMDGDNLVDITSSSTSSQSISILTNLADQGFSTPVTYRAGVASTGHRFLDMNNDGLLDMLTFGTSSSTIRLGRVQGPPPAPSFRRGDADGNGKIEINDPVTVLNFLFRGGQKVSCPDAGDADDNGSLQLTDAVSVLRFLFMEGEPPAPPGPRICGQDNTEDQLTECTAKC
jgi:hypothetical protein